jgi:DNA (cytosine-5)-methyltransferase 1
MSTCTSLYRGNTQAPFNFDELIIDNFAGGGGASMGIEMATGRQVDIAINHDIDAVRMHEVNHPHTKHYCESVWDVDPREVCAGRPVGLAWFSPDCKHHSKARGGKPVEKNIRGLAWVVRRWVAMESWQRPKVVILENVEEFQDWGPLAPAGNGNFYPCPKRKGRTFKNFVKMLKSYGYQVEWKELRACDYGTPTIRKRLFLVARCDGLRIVWPTPTHGDPASTEVKSGKLKPWRTAADCIDWSVPCPSIFERKKPLADTTCRRIAKGIMRYVVNAAKPYIVRATHGEPDIGKSATPSGSAKKPGSAGCGSTGRQIDVSGAPFIPTLIQTGYGERKGQAPRSLDINRPLGTVVATQKHALVGAFMAKHYTGAVGSDLNDPLGTVTGVDHHSLVTALMTKFNTGSVGFECNSPLHTITAGGEQARPGTAITQGVVTANLVHMGHGEGKKGGKRFSHGVRSLQVPINTVTASGATAGLVTSHMVKLRGDNVGSGTDEPLHTISAQGTHHGEVRAFLIKYYGTDQDPALKAPLHTITTKDRFGLVVVRGELYAIVDIGLRMLTPRELFTAQGFPLDYVIEHDGKGKAFTKTTQVARCGNSVCPPLAEALVRANYVEIREEIAA